MKLFEKNWWKSTLGLNEIGVNKPDIIIPIIKPQTKILPNTEENIIKIKNLFLNSNIKLAKELKIDINSLNKNGTYVFSSFSPTNRQEQIYFYLFRRMILEYYNNLYVSPDLNQTLVSSFNKGVFNKTEFEKNFTRTYDNINEIGINKPKAFTLSQETKEEIKNFLAERLAQYLNKWRNNEEDQWIIDIQTAMNISIYIENVIIEYVKEQMTSDEEYEGNKNQLLPEDIINFLEYDSATARHISNILHKYIYANIDFQKLKNLCYQKAQKYEEYDIIDSYEIKHVVDIVLEDNYELFEFDELIGEDPGGLEQFLKDNLFKDSLQEIGVNKPGKIKAIVNSPTHIEIILGKKHFYFHKNKDHPDYYIGWGSSMTTDIIKRSEYGSFFEVLEKAGDTILLGVSKSRVEIVDRLDEIGINNPNPTPEKTIELSKKISYSPKYRISDGTRYDIFVKYGYDYADNWGSIEEWINSLDNITLSKVYKDLLGLWNNLNSLEEIGVNKPVLDKEYIKSWKSWKILAKKVGPIITYSGFNSLDDVENAWASLKEDVYSHATPEEIDNEKRGYYGGELWFRTSELFELKYGLDYEDAQAFFIGLKLYKKRKKLKNLPDKEVIEEIGVNKPTQYFFHIKIPTGWKEENNEIISNREELAQYFETFKNENQSLASIIDMEYGKDLLLAVSVGNVYPISTILSTCEMLQEAIYYYFQDKLDLHFNYSEYGTEYNNLVVKQFDKRIINLKEIEDFIKSKSTLKEIGVNKPYRTWDFTKFIPNFDPAKIKVGDEIKTQLRTEKVEEIDPKAPFSLNHKAFCRAFYTNVEMGYGYFDFTLEEFNIENWKKENKGKINEIGINNPNKLGLVYIKNDTFELENSINGKKLHLHESPDYPDYYIGWGISDQSVKIIMNSPYGAFFEVLKEDEDSGYSLVGILKSKTKLVNKIQEIGINNPNITPEKIWHFINVDIKKAWDNDPTVFSRYVKVIKKYGYYDIKSNKRTVYDTIKLLSQKDLINLYQDLKNIINIKIDEIGVNIPQITPEIVDQLDNKLFYHSNFEIHDQRNDILYKYGYFSQHLTFLPWLETLSQKDLMNLYKELKNLDKSIQENVFSKDWWKNILTESEAGMYNTPQEQEKDAYQDYILSNHDKIEKAATEFNVPISDMEIAFNGGHEVILTDEIWKKLKNSNSYKIKKLEDAIKFAQKEKINPQPYITSIKNEEQLPLPLVLNWGDGEYYLVGGDVELALYKALNVIPIVLMAHINIKSVSKEEASLNELKLKHEQRDIIKKFFKWALKELQISQPPSGLTISYDTKEAKERHAYGYFDPESNKIWVYVKNRGMADILRTLAHELVHRKQAEEGRIDMRSGETGSPIENEANAQAGILLRNYGEKHSNIFESLQEIGINMPGKVKATRILDDSDEYILLDNKYSLSDRTMEGVASKSYPDYYGEWYTKKSEEYLELSKEPYFKYFVELETVNGEDEDIEVLLGIPKKYVQIVDEINEISDLSNKFPWKSSRDIATRHFKYTFNSDQYEYEVLFKEKARGIYERMYFAPRADKEKFATFASTGEGSAIKVNNTVMDITLDFLSKIDNKFRELQIAPISQSRHRLVMYNLNKHLPSKFTATSEVDIDGEEIITITLKKDELKEIGVNIPVRTWDFTKFIPNFNSSKIKIGDFIKTRDETYKVRNISKLDAILSIIQFSGTTEDGEYISYYDYELEYLNRKNDLSNPLNEIGENTSNSFAFRKIMSEDNLWIYHFNSENNLYKVTFHDYGEGEWSRSYRSLTTGEYYGETGENIPLKINATVMKITVDFLENNHNCKKLNIAPLDQKRYKLVKRYLENNLPKGWTIEYLDGEIVINKQSIDEIGVNLPGKIKAVYSGDEKLETHITLCEDDDIELWNGDWMENFPGYWCIWRSEDSIEFLLNWLKHSEFWKYFKFLGKREDYYRKMMVYGIPKFQIQIVDKIQEIGINNPNRIKAAIFSSNNLDDTGSVILLNDNNKVNITLWDGDLEDDFPGYWCKWAVDTNENSLLDKLKKSKYFKYFQRLSITNHHMVVYGIPKDQVEIIKKLEEISDISTNKFEWKFVSKDAKRYVYKFNSNKNTYRVSFVNKGQLGVYERYYYNPSEEGDEPFEQTNEGSAIKVNNTVMDITLDFLSRVGNKLVMLTVVPIDYRRYNLVKYVLKKNLPSNYIVIPSENEDELIIFPKKQ